MTKDKFYKATDEMLDHVKVTLDAKALDYACGADRLHNFKTAARLQNTHMVKALGGMMAKHTVSVYDMIANSDDDNDYPLSLWEEKIGDHIAYLLILWAMLRACDTVNEVID